MRALSAAGEHLGAAGSTALELRRQRNELLRRASQPVRRRPARSWKVGVGLSVAIATLIFRAFESAHPRDARTQDAHFLRAMARLRRGDVEGTRALLRGYLATYPEGLRRAEAERVLKESPQPLEGE